MPHSLDRYRAEAVAALGPRAQPWRLPFGVALAFLGQAILTPVIFFAAAAVVSLTVGGSFFRVLDRLAAVEGPAALVATLATFLGFTVGILAAMRFLHRRSPRLLLSWEGRFDWAMFLRVALPLTALAILAVILTMPLVDYIPNVTPAQWAVWVIPALAMTLVQVFSEEFVFRGYLQANLAARFRSPVIWIGLPAAVFGSMHLPTALAFGANWWLILLAPTLIGLIAAHLTARTGGIAAATGLHFANNCVGLLIVAPPGPFGALSLYLYPIVPSDVATVRPMILANLALILVGYAVWLAAMRRRDARIA